MSEKTVKIITCNGPLNCPSECREVIPSGWITFVGEPNLHLCPRCATEDNMKRQAYYQSMSMLDKRRGD